MVDLCYLSYYLSMSSTIVGAGEKGEWAFNMQRLIILAVYYFLYPKAISHFRKKH